MNGLYRRPTPQNRPVPPRLRILRNPKKSYLPRFFFPYEPFPAGHPGRCTTKIPAEVCDDFSVTPDPVTAIAMMALPEATVTGSVMQTIAVPPLGVAPSRGLPHPLM